MNRAFQPQLYITATALILILISLATNSVSIYIFLGAIALPCSIFIAFRFPAYFLAFSILIHHAVDHEIGAVTGGRLFITLSSIKIYSTDPFLLIISVSISLYAILNPSRFLYVVKDNSLLFLFFTFSICLAFYYTIPRGFNAIGEFRAYYTPIIFTLYALVFLRHKYQIVQAFKFSSIILLLLIPIAVLQGAIAFDYTISPRTRWLTSSSMLALVHALTAIYIGQAMRQWRLSKVTLILLVIFAVVLLIATLHRSVWMAAAVTVFVFFLSPARFRSRPPRIVLIGIGGLASLMLVIGLTSIGGDFFSLLQDRTLAFTSFQDDPTANWRYLLWQSSLDLIAENPLVGKGFGQHFSFIVGRELVTSSPHNLYITFAVQTGLIGATIFVGFMVSSGLRMWRTFRTSPDPLIAMICLSGLTIWISSISYFTAYSGSLSGFVYLGIALAACREADIQKWVAFNQTEQNRLTG